MIIATAQKTSLFNSLSLVGLITMASRNKFVQAVYGLTLEVAAILVSAQMVKQPNAVQQMLENAVMVQ